MDKQDAISATLQLKHDAGLMASILQALGQYVTSLNRMSSEVTEAGIRSGDIPAEAIDAIAPVPPGTPCNHADVSYGFVVPTGWS